MLGVASGFTDVAFFAQWHNRMSYYYDVILYNHTMKGKRLPSTIDSSLLLKRQHIHNAAFIYTCLTRKPMLFCQPFRTTIVENLFQVRLYGAVARALWAEKKQRTGLNVNSIYFCLSQEMFRSSKYVKNRLSGRNTCYARMRSIIKHMHAQQTKEVTCYVNIWCVFDGWLSMSKVFVRKSEVFPFFKRCSCKSRTFYCKMWKRETYSYTVHVNKAHHVCSEDSNMTDLPDKSMRLPLKYIENMLRIKHIKLYIYSCCLLCNYWRLL